MLLGFWAQQRGGQAEMHKCSEKMQKFLLFRLYQIKRKWGRCLSAGTMSTPLAPREHLPPHCAAQDRTCPAVPRLPAPALLSEEGPPQLCLPPSRMTWEWWPGSSGLFVPQAEQDGFSGQAGMSSFPLLMLAEVHRGPPQCLLVPQL